MNVIEGTLNAQGLKIAIVATRWNKSVVDGLIEGAGDYYRLHGGNSADLTLFRVPGSIEIPLTVQKIAAAKKYDGIVALAAIIQGDTEHHEVVASYTQGGLSKISLEYGIPIGFGILTTQNLAQALERAGGKSGNKGEEAISAVMECLNLYDKINKIG